jgi:hypothetical protein
VNCSDACRRVLWRAPSAAAGAQVAAPTILSWLLDIGFLVTKNTQRINVFQNVCHDLDADYKLFVTQSVFLC